MGTKRTHWDIQRAFKTAKYEPSGAKDIQREQGIVHSQSRAYQNDSKYSKINKNHQLFMRNQ